MSSEKAKLFFIPFPTMSHFAATAKMAELLAERDDALEITVIVMKTPQTNLDSYINDSPSSSIKFLQLPPNPEIPDAKKEEKPAHGPSAIWEFIETQKVVVKEAVGEIIGATGKNTPVGFVIDMFCTTFVDVADELGIPTYVFFTCGAGVLSLMYKLHDLVEKEENLLLTKYLESKEAIVVPGYKYPVPAAVWPILVFDKEFINVFVNMMTGFKKSKGILGNTFLDFEHDAVEALRGDPYLPPFYPVGLILQDGADEAQKSKPEYKEIMDWLEEQPDSSVVFLCFGSQGAFSKDKVKEIAAGLELSSQRFLWALRKPPSEGKLGFPTEYDNYDEVLPEGFLDRTKGKGKVIGWAPQMEALAHRAVGGFVSHCGWNSTLESIWFGVPVATLPLSAEQQANAFQLVKEFEIAVEIKIDYRNEPGEIIPAEKIATAITELMDLENPIREKVKYLQEKSRKTLLKSEPSDQFIGRFIQDFVALPRN